MDSLNSLGPQMWALALCGMGVDLTVLLEHSRTFHIHYFVLLAQVPSMALLVRYSPEHGYCNVLDLSNEDNKVVLCLLEFLYLGKYTELSDGETWNHQLVTQNTCQVGFHRRVYLLAKRHHALGLAAYAWGREQESLLQLQTTIAGGDDGGATAAGMFGGFVQQDTQEDENQAEDLG